MEREVTVAPPLSHRVRHETREAHTTAERSGIMRDVLRGAVSREAYVALLSNLHAIYVALEAAIQSNRTHPALSGVDWQVLARAKALEADIRAFSCGNFPAPNLEASTRAYVERLGAIGTGKPALLFAHAYLRYLGDLYGGQIMHRILAKTFPEDRGFAFYGFDGIDNVDEFRESFRRAFDVVCARGASADEVVLETQRGYELHAALFNELASPDAAWRTQQPR